MQCRLAISQNNAGHSVQSLNAVYSQITQCSQLIQCTVSQYSQSIQCRSQCTVTTVYNQSKESSIQSSKTVLHTLSQYSASYSQKIQNIIYSVNTEHHSQPKQSIIPSQPRQRIIQSANTVCRQAVIRYSVAYRNTVIKSDQV